nr:MAG TPA_asm: hypothetical protein [Bacteriophage sp.]
MLSVTTIVQISFIIISFFFKRYIMIPISLFIK